MKHFKFNYLCSTFYKNRSAITVKSITTSKINFRVRISKVADAGKKFNFRLSTLLQMAFTKCFLHENAVLFSMKFVCFVIATNHIFLESAILMTTPSLSFQF